MFESLVVLTLSLAISRVLIYVFAATVDDVREHVGHMTWDDLDPGGKSCDLALIKRVHHIRPTYRCRCEDELLVNLFSHFVVKTVFICFTCCLNSVFYTMGVFVAFDDNYNLY